MRPRDAVKLRVKPRPADQQLALADRRSVTSICNIPINDVSVRTLPREMG